MVEQQCLLTRKFYTSCGDLILGRPQRLTAEAAFRQDVSKYENWLSQGLISLNKVPADVREYIKSKEHDSREFWFELLGGLDFYDAKILEHVYQSQEGATTLQLLVRHMRNVGIKREALRRRVLMLADLGLLDVAERTKPLCIRGQVELEAKVISLIRGVFQRLGVDQK